jgi:MFS family permease
VQRAPLTLRAQRVGVAAIFAVHGAVAGTFAARIPAISEHLRLSPAALGLALFMPAIGSLSAMPFTGRLMHRVGGTAATRLMLGVLCVLLALPALAPSLPALCVVLLVFGASAGTTDVAMNAQGSALEQRMGTSIMSSLHGMWSVGGFVAAGIGALAAHVDVAAPLHLAVMAAVLLAAGQAASLLLAPTPRGSGEASAPKLGLPSGAVLLIGLVAFCAVFGEIGGSDWCAVYMRKVLHSASATAAATYGVFAFAMAACRLAGDRVVRRFGAVRTVRVGAIVGAAGGVLIVTAISEPLAIVGFAMLGVGVAVIVPLAFAAAGRLGTAPGDGGTQIGAGNAIAGVATIAYGAGLAAPGIIGGVANATSFPVSFVLITALVAVIVLSARVVRPRSEAGEPMVDVSAVR